MIQFAVDVLGVRDIIVCGHYGCSGVRAALLKEQIGLADNWLRHVTDVQNRHCEELKSLADDTARLNRLCELNVAQQVANVCDTTILRDAWKRGQNVAVHGWIYSLDDGLLRNLNVSQGVSRGVGRAV